ncbi:MAG: acetylxylan esterase [Chloroflexi bacterium]|nr:acetylxylan esterase [Chloroflexota bacterium]MCY3938739.1 acetylxylan esterase [Chloroflexota bacterium]
MPLLFDMSWDELQTYEGSNPKPPDFDDFWERGLAEVESIDPQLEYVSSSFQTAFAECFDLYFTGAGGARVHAKLIRPKEAPEPHPAVIMFHGYRGDSGDWMDKLGYAAAGFTVAAMDCRGQGGLSEDSGSVKGPTLSGQIIRGLEDSPEKLLFRQIFLDTAQLTKIVMAMPEVDAARVGVTGASQGGGLTLACASLVPEVKRAAPVFPFLCDYKRVWQMDQAKDAYLELQEFFRHFDPLHEREDETFTRLGYIDVQHLAGRIRGRVMMGVGLMDTICPPSTQFAAYNKIESEKDLRVYPDFGHEMLPGHSDAVFQFMSEL